MKSKLGISLMTIGAVLVIMALSLAVYNIYTDKKAGERSREILDVLESAITDNNVQMESDYNNIADNNSAPALNTPKVSDNPNSKGNNNKKNQNSINKNPVIIDDLSYIGVISIPDLGIKLPVLENWSDYNLRVAPCRYSGDAETDDLIIAAHNYSSHFGNLRNLDSGCVVYFIDTLGRRYSYVVAQLESIPGSEGIEMFSGNWALSLFTCNYDGSERLTVRCNRID